MVHGTRFVSCLDGIDTVRLHPRQRDERHRQRAGHGAADEDRDEAAFLGTDVPPAVRPKRTATSAAAMELPIVRAIAFMLVATPVSPA